jgi:putative hydrolase of the HAD superfamily
VSLEAFDAVGFDIDGTLYPEIVMYLCGLPAFLRDPVLMSTFGKMRRDIRSIQDADETRLDFMELQARQVLLRLGRETDAQSLERMRDRINSHIYRMWEKSFSMIRPYQGVRELFRRLKEAGIHIALLTDFPPGVKPRALGVAQYVDHILCAEDTGRLKPDTAPFTAMAESFGITDFARILYVGNSYDKDIIGAKAAGMQTAFIMRSKRKADRMHTERTHGAADVIFSDFSQLAELMLHTLDSRQPGKD